MATSAGALVRFSATNAAPDGNNAFTAFVPVPGPNDNGETFRYTPDTTKTGVSGTIYLTSTGKSRRRFIVAT